MGVRVSSVQTRRNRAERSQLKYSHSLVLVGLEQELTSLLVERGLGVGVDEKAADDLGTRNDGE